MSKSNLSTFPTALRAGILAGQSKNMGPLARVSIADLKRRANLNGVVVVEGEPFSLPSASEFD